MPDNKMLVQELETKKYWVFDLEGDSECPDGHARIAIIEEGPNTAQCYFFDKYNIPQEGAKKPFFADLDSQGWTKQN